jgi:hypothetical protein
MNLQATSEALRNLVQDEIAVPFDLRTFYDGFQITQPETGRHMIAWVVPGNTTQISFGVKTFRSSGVLTLQLYDLLSKGEGGLRTLADSISRILRSRTVAPGLTLLSPSINVVGRSGKLLQINVTCPYTADTQ